MIRRITVAALQLGALAFSLAVFLLAGEVWRTSPGLIDSTIRELEAIFRDSTTQWMVLVCLAFYFVVFSIFEFRSSPAGKSWRVGNPILWQCGFVVLALLVYAIGYSKSSNSTATLIVLGTIVLGKALLIWVGWKRGNSEQRRIWVICVLLCLLTGSVFWQQEANRVFQYKGVGRWTGVWDNPNLFGLLMGLCLVLSLGMAIRIWQAASNRIWRIFGAFFCLVAALIVGFGLFKSFSRGAWLGSAIGVVYLTCVLLKNQRKYSTGRSTFWNRRTGMQIVAIVFALAILGFWQFRFIEWQPARRAFSAANVNDFSWRNRVAAWTGAIQMMSDRPFLGFGWAKAEAAYNEKYRPPQIENGAAIQMNDYFMLGISAGVPALVCFLVYAGLSLRGESRIQKVEIGDRRDACPTFDWLQAACRAGAIVLLVGFFFDGGLFKLATGSVFWILLELGRVDPGRARHSVRAVVADNEEGGAQRSDAPCHRSRWEIWLRRAAWALGIAAFSESAILISTPLFRVNNTTLAISRHYLVPPSAVADLNLLATNAVWNDKKLKPLLQHASLANYNRQLINWKLDEQVYRDYVLSPLIDPQRDGQLAWRRKLWEYFYLPIRKENDPGAAAEIVLKFLHQRTTSVETGPITIEAMWQQKQADSRGFDALKVAAFRSVGIPARLNENSQAEIFADGKWQIAP